MRQKTNLVRVLLSALLIAAFIAGCYDSKKDEHRDIMDELAKSKLKIGPDTTIGSLAQIYAPEFIPLRGYAIVGELRGTGSAQCPAQVREYLKKYILRQISVKHIDDFINGKDTAVVVVEGLMPMSSIRGRRFDVRVSVLGSTETSSLEYGQLYGAELHAAGSFGAATKALAKVEGSIYIDKIDGVSDKRIGYILSGGKTLDKYFVRLTLKEPDYIATNAIRNELIKRFGSGVAIAKSAARIELKIPSRYTYQKERFLEMVKAMHLNLVGQNRKDRIAELIANLSAGADREKAEFALEAMGKDVVKPLKGTLSSPDTQVRLRAARVMLNLGSDDGLETLRDIALDKSSDYRNEAIDAIGTGAKRNDAASICRRLLKDNDIDIQMAAYEQLRKFDDITIVTDVVGGTFVLNQVASSSRKLIYVARSGQPRVAIIGGPLKCADDLFIQSQKGNITINSLAGQDYVTVMRKVPEKPAIPPITLRCSNDLGDIIQTLGNSPVRKSQTDPIGLGVSYADIIALVKSMVENGGVEGQFYAGPMPQIGLK